MQSNIEKVVSMFEAVGFKTKISPFNDIDWIKMVRRPVVLTIHEDDNNAFTIFTSIRTNTRNGATYEREFSMYSVQIECARNACTTIVRFWKKNGIDLKPKRGK